jgi:methionyl-tRNA synthetase
MVKDKFYVTTPIYYSNASPHLGGAYTTIAADILARWNRLRGKDVFFLTGTDEHGQKIQETAEKAGKTPKEFVDDIAKEFKEAFKLINITNDNFIRTTDSYHEKEVKQILQELYNKKFIYKGMYESYYCIGCEQYKTETDLVEGKCPLHPNREIELRKEESYMFKLSKFQDRLLKAIKNGELDIQPIERRKEIISFIEQGLRDISFSRLKEKVSWGIELPFDKKHTCFVWVDAFWNYISGLKTSTNKKKFWPADIQLMAKDIIRVHATIWAAILLALDYELPKKMFVHGYFTINEQKMSKSLGNVISPIYLSQKYGSDSVRYYLMRNIAFGSDGDVSESSLINRHNNELADKLGNLISRVSALAEKYGLEKAEELDSSNLINKVSSHLDKLEFDKALNEIFQFIDVCNLYIQNKKPWETHDKKVLYQLSNAIKDVSILLSPFIPETSEKISKIFNFDISLKSLGKPLKISKISKAPILFAKIDIEPKPLMENTNKLKTPQALDNTNNNINSEKAEFKIGKIIDVKDHPNADKLYVLTVDFGSEKRTIVAGLRKHYKKEELYNKKAIFVTNLAPAMLRGIESNGMILAAVSEDESKIVFLTSKEDTKEGSKIELKDG